MCNKMEKQIQCFNLLHSCKSKVHLKLLMLSLQIFNKYTHQSNFYQAQALSFYTSQNFSYILIKQQTKRKIVYIYG